MQIASFAKISSRRHLVWLALLNGATVSSLYWAQSLVTRAATEFGQGPSVRLMPSATLAGYAAGVALLAAVARDLTTSSGLFLHLLLLVAGLCAAASAPDPVVASLACFVIGLGCSLTQRLLASATSAVPPEARAETIGWMIAAGLCGIVFARACVPIASAHVGWRAMFWTDALLVTVLGLAATVGCDRIDRVPHRDHIPAPSLTALWRAHPVLRRAAYQQAVVFAGFNLGWAIFPRLLAADRIAPALPTALVATLGAAAAIIAGRAAARWTAGAVATIGLRSVLVAIAMVGACSSVSPPTLLLVTAMMLLDTGTQAALVANQTRAQAVATSPAMRGRLTATVTTIGFAGGAVGAAIGNLLG